MEQRPQVRLGFPDVLRVVVLREVVVRLVVLAKKLYIFFINRSSRFPEPKWKTCCGQSELVFQEISKMQISFWSAEYNFFILVLKKGRSSYKKLKAPEMPMASTSHCNEHHVRRHVYLTNVIVR